MVASTLAVAVFAAAAPPAQPCRAPLPHGPSVPAPIVLHTSCGGFLLATSGRMSRLPRHWLARHGDGTGRRYGARLQIRRTSAGRFFLLEGARVVWRSTYLYPRDGGDVAFGPRAFAFASYRRGIYLTDLRGPERLVARGRGLHPYAFTRRGDLIVIGDRSIRIVAPNGMILRSFAYRPRNGYSFDEPEDTLYFVTPGRRLALASGARVTLQRRVGHIDDGMLNIAVANLLVFSGSRSITVTRRDGTLIARAAWRSRLHSDAFAVSPDGSSVAFRLTDAHTGARSSTATVYVLRAGATDAQPIYRHQLGPSGCGAGASLRWNDASLLYSSSDGTLAILDPRAQTATDLTRLARSLPHRSTPERASAGWRSDFRR